jgi:UDP-glucose 4-epimerase
LLTGVGYIGAALLRRLADRGERVVALENFYCTPREAVHAVLPAGTTLIEGDVAEPADVARAFDCASIGHEPLVVFHLAAQPSAAIAARDPETTERTNVKGARMVLEAARERGAKVVFGGSFRVYGDDLAGRMIDEQTPYGRVGDLSHLSKLYVEQLGRMIGGEFVSVRLGVTYGLSPIMKREPAFMTVPNLFCQRAINGDVLQVIEDRYLAFIHVDDAVQALLGAAAGEGPTWDVVNAAPEVASIGQLAHIVQRIAQQRGQWARVLGAMSSAAEAFRVTSKAGTPGRRSLEDGLGEVFDFFASQP